MKRRKNDNTLGPTTEDPDKQMTKAEKSAKRENVYVARLDKERAEQ